MAWVNTTTMMGRCSVTRILFVLMALVLSGCKSGTAVVTGIPTDLPTATSTEAVTVSATTESSASTATGARPNWVVYTNPDYGFSFRYPVTWETMEGRNYIGLSQGTFNLVIGYRHTAEDVNICCRRELPEGRLSSAGTVMCIGQEVTKALLECEGKIKAVDYESTSGIPARDVVFTIYLEDFNADYDAAAIPEGVQSEVDLIVASLETFEPAADLGTPTPRSTRLPPTPVPATATPGPAVLVTAIRGANVRAGPGTDYRVQGYLEPGAQAGVTGRYGDWWQIEHDSTSAWVYAGIVTATNTANVVEIESPPSPVPAYPTLIPSPARSEAIEETRWIDVDLSEQKLTAYEHGDPVRTTLVSTGLPGTPTPTGQFRIWIKLRYDDMEGPGYYLEDVPYVMYFYRGYGLHGTFWHENFGHPMSHGCVNLSTPEAKWLFDFADVGTLVNVHD